MSTLEKYPETQAETPVLDVPMDIVLDYKTDIVRPETHSHYTVRTDGATMSDGHSYAVVKGIPKHPITPLTIGFTSAWWTSSRGHNRRTLEHFTRLGIPTILIGAEGSYRPSGPNGIPLPKEPISLTRSAHSFHEILNIIASSEDLSTQTSTRDMVILGESRGAMIAKGIIAIANGYGRNVVYADVTAPCFPEAFQPKDILKLMKQLYGERNALATLAGNLTLRRLVHYPATLDLHPEAVSANIHTFGPLFSGEAGELAKAIDSDFPMHITTFSDDFASMPKRWARIYANHPNVRIKQIDGAHLTIAHPRTLEHIEGRLLGLFSEVDKHGPDASKIDYSRVHLDDGESPPTF